MKRIGAVPLVLLLVLLAACQSGAGTDRRDQTPTAVIEVTAVNDLTVSLTGSSPAAEGILAWNWTFGDGNSGSGQTVTHTYASPGTYLLTLTVVGAGGASSATQGSVTVTQQQTGTGVVSGSLSFGAAGPAGEFVPGELIVLYETGLIGTLSAELTVTAGTLTLERALSLPAMGLYRNPALDHAQTLAAARQLEALPSVRSATPNRIVKPFAVPNDEYYSYQWHYPAMNLEAAWDITTGAPDTVVAVIDTGILWHATNENLRHPDLTGKVLPGYDFISDAGIGADGDGRDPDPFDPGDSDDPFNVPHSWHGSHVAGTIAASTNNNIGVAGVDWHAKILPVRVLGQGGGLEADILEGLLWSAGLTVNGVPANPNPARVINMSLGGPGACTPPLQAVFDAVLATGAIIIVAAGNADEDATNTFPANCRGVITVGATDIRNGRSYFSNYGPVLDVMAPGGDVQNDLNGDGLPDGVLSLTLVDTANPPVFDYWFQQGTSMAAPHVAGLVSLMVALDPELTAGQALYALRSSVIPMNAAQCNRPTAADCGAGRVDAAAALQLVQSGNLPDSEPGPDTGQPTGPMLVAALQEGAEGLIITGSQEAAEPFTSYSFESTVGPVMLVAWVDEDRDGQISSGDWYGEYPSAVTVQPGGNIGLLDITLDRVTSQTVRHALPADRSSP